MRIALIHALKHSLVPIEASFARLWPEATLMNLLDDSLSADLARDGKLTPAMTDRFLAVGGYAASTGANAILFTCSAFGPCIEAVARELSPMPVLKPNQAMIEQAVARGHRIGLLSTFPPTLQSMPGEFPGTVQLVPKLAEGAMAALDRGDRAEHGRSQQDRLAGFRGADEFACGVGDDLTHQRAARGAAAGAELLQYTGTRHGPVHELCLSGTDRGRHSAGGEHRRHHPDPAAAQGRQAAGHREAGRGAGQGPAASGENGLREKAMITLTSVLALSGILFAIAVAGVFLNRKNIIVLLMCIELMLLAVNFNFVAFSRFRGDIAGQIFVFFILTVAAAEAAIGLAILVVLFRERSSIEVEDLDTLQG